MENFVVSGVDADGAEQEWAIQASNVEGAAKQARGHGMNVRSIVTQAERDAVAAAASAAETRSRRPQQCVIVDFTVGAIFRFVFWAVVFLAIPGVLLWLLAMLLLRVN